MFQFITNLFRKKSPPVVQNIPADTVEETTARVSQSQLRGYGSTYRAPVSAPAEENDGLDTLIGTALLLDALSSSPSNSSCSGSDDSTPSQEFVGGGGESGGGGASGSWDSDSSSSGSDSSSSCDSSSDSSSSCDSSSDSSSSDS